MNWKTLAAAVVFYFVGVVTAGNWVQPKTGTATLYVDALHIKTPAWVELAVTDSQQTGEASSGGCMRSQVDLDRAFEAAAMQFPREPVKRLTVTVRVSWEPGRPDFLGASPFSGQRCE